MVASPWCILPCGGLERLAYFWGKLVLDGACNAAAEPALYQVYAEVGDGVDAPHAIDVVALCDQVPGFQRDPRVAPGKAFEVVPVGGGGSSVEQAGLGQQAARCPDAADARARCRDRAQGVHPGRAGPERGQWCPPDRRENQHIQRWQVPLRQLPVQRQTVIQGNGPGTLCRELVDHTGGLAIVTASGLRGGGKYLHGERDAGGQGIGVEQGGDGVHGVDSLIERPKYHDTWRNKHIHPGGPPPTLRR